MNKNLPRLTINCNTSYLPLYKKSLLASAIALACLTLASEAVAQTIHYNGNSNTPNGSYTLNASNAATTNGKNVAGYYYTSGSGTITGGNVTVTSGGKAKLVYGAYTTTNRTVDNNKVNMGGGVVLRDVVGGRSNLGNATNNTATVSGRTVNGNVFGGWSNSGSATNNTATVSGGRVNGYVYGGRSNSGDVTNNSATVSGGTVKIHVYGGWSNSGDATNNTATVSGGTVKKSVFGGRSTRSNATNNTATVSGGTTVQRDVFGGWSNSGNATNNTATVSGGMVRRNVYGGRSHGDATNNTVTVSGGTVRRNVFGGRSTRSNATNNTVTVSGGTVRGSVFGGWSHNLGDATNNTVTIKKGSSGNPTFGTGTMLYGGVSSVDAKSGNTLNMHTTGIEVKNIKNFENLYFYVQSDTGNGDVFLTLTGDPAAPAATDIRATNIGVGLEGSDSQLVKGDQVTLIKKNSGTLQTDPSLTNNVSGMAGISTLYEFELEKTDSQTLVANVIKAGINPQVKSLSEARTSAVDFVNRANDLAHGEGMGNLVQATQAEGINGFMALGGGKYRTETGSHIDVTGVNLLVGAGTGIANGAGKLTLGGFVEYGKGNYDSYNDFTDRPDVHASGKTHYYGVGLMAKQTFNSDWFVSGG